MASKKKTEATEEEPKLVPLSDLPSASIARPKPHLIAVEHVHSANGDHFFEITGVPDLDGQEQTIHLTMDEIEHIYHKTREVAQLPPVPEPPTLDDTD